MKMKYLLILLTSINYLCFAQVGINTKTPQEDLHVNGNIQITKDFNVGGTASESGNSGKKGDLLISNGTGSSPEWVEPYKLKIPQIVNISNRTTTGTLIKKDTYWNIQFNESPQNLPLYINYDNLNHEFKIKKSGFYIVNANTKANVICTSGACGGTFRITFLKNGTNIASNSTGYNNNTVSMQENINTSTFLKEGDIIKIVLIYTRDMRANEASASFTYLSQ
jgi:hypothetical protein